MTSSVLNSVDLYDLRLKSLWNAFRKEGLSFWLLCVYLMFEYVRPQSIYPVLAFWPWTTATMGATALSLLTSGRRAQVATPANGFLLSFSAVLVCSSINAYRPEVSFAWIHVYFLWIVAYALIIHIVTTEHRMLLLIVAFVLFNLKMSLFATRGWIAIGFAFRAWGTSGSPGWFSNSGEFGIEMCVFFPIVTYLALGLRPYLPRWKYLALLSVAGTSLVGMIASSSRGALLGGAAVMVFMLVRSRYKARAFAALAVVGAVFFLAIPAQQKQRMSESGEDSNSVSRLTLWSNGIAIANDHPVLGVGYENWTEYYADHYDATNIVLVSHNIFVQAAAELGYTGLLAFLLLIGCTFALNARTRALARRAGPQGRLTHHLAMGLDGALIGFMVSGFFVTVLYYPYFWINLAMTVALNTVAKRVAVAGQTPPGVGDRPRVGAPPSVSPGNPRLHPVLPRR
jgi:O-antigen ligase